MFLGTCLNICALFKDLKDRIQTSSIVAAVKSTSDTELKIIIKDIVDYHNSILDLIKMLEKVYAEIFFGQFFSVLSVLCTQAYLMEQVRIGI